MLEPLLGQVVHPRGGVEAGALEPVLGLALEGQPLALERALMVGVLLLRLGDGQSLLGLRVAFEDRQEVPRLDLVPLPDPEGLDPGPGPGTMVRIPPAGSRQARA